MARRKRSEEWWIRAGYAFEYAAVSVRSLCDELAIDRPYFISQIRARGWEIIRTEGTLVELRKLYNRAVSKAGERTPADYYLWRIEAVEDAHAHLVRMVRECEANPAA
jgi:hypothetical protein